MEVLSVASEVYPLIKTGGLADVVGALPGALRRLNVNMRVLVPGYRQVIAKIAKPVVLKEMASLFGGPARLLDATVSGLDLIVVDAPHLYDRDGSIYASPSGADWTDNWKRFGAFSQVAGQIGRGLIDGYSPAIIHAHDWQAGLVPAYLRFGPPTKVKSVMTVHNLAFQGQFPREIFGELQLPAAANSVDGVEYYGAVGYLKAGLQCADAITTVSPTYASEIRTPEFGMGLEGLLNSRTSDVYGILNGIDLEAWDPGTDTALVEPYRISTVRRRAANKRAVRERFGLEHSDAPLFGVVSRLTWQKGIDILANVLDRLVGMGAQLCVLGSGDGGIEDAIANAAGRHPGRIGIVRGYDEQLSHMIQGGADAILIPSRFEPCGLTQLIGLRYGCVPVVTRTGGLADTVVDANEAALSMGAATGVQISPLNENTLTEALRRAIALYRDEAVWAHIQRRGMKSDVGWDQSARKYVALYEKLMGRAVSNGD
ncbi:MAG: glycogen synthase GlgA [Hyphomicrobiaceae bacterium]|nr:glycogen synthase GlgA [Hyphomicrobiaceae bacterium]